MSDNSLIFTLLVGMEENLFKMCIALYALTSMCGRAEKEKHMCARSSH
jgi:hypothetical protein